MNNDWMNEQDQSFGLSDIAGQAKRALVPVSPASTFRARLKDGLMMAAHHQQTHLTLANPHNEPGWGWVIGAAAIGSAAGIVAFVLRLRAHNQRLVHSTNADAK